MLVGAEEGEGVAAWLLPVTVSCWVMRGGRRRGEKQRMEAADRSASISLEGGRLKKYDLPKEVLVGCVKKNFAT